MATNESNGDKFYEKFQNQFNEKFSGKFIFKTVLFKAHADPETSLLLLISAHIEEFGFIFEKENKYIGIDFKEESNDLILLTLNLIILYNFVFEYTNIFLINPL